MRALCSTDQLKSENNLVRQVSSLVSHLLVFFHLLFRFPHFVLSNIHTAWCLCILCFPWFYS